MDEIYRFRSCDRLFGDKGELDSRVIYFAEPAQLNDPVEGTRKLFWHGDQIAWANLFRHYLCCLNEVYILFRVGHYERPATPADIPINKPWDNTPGNDHKAMLDLIWNEVSVELPLEEISIWLEELDRPVYSSELEFYIASIHECAFAAMDLAHETYKMRPPGAPRSEPFSVLAPHLPKYLKSLMHGLDDPVELDKELEKLNHRLQQERLKAKASLDDFTDSDDSRDKCFLLLDFPREYVSQLTRATSPDWRAACFTETYGNPAQWGHYADGHKGICLVFEPHNDEMGASLILSDLGNDRNGGEPANAPEPESYKFYFKPIRYIRSLDDVDFFKRICAMPEESVRSVWFTSADGLMSSAGPHLAAEADLESWRKATWRELLSDVCTKTKEWQHEKELRLVDFGVAESSPLDVQPRMAYEFSALKGVIFGVNTSDDHKFEIIKSIKEQCRLAGRTAFEFRQAELPTQGGGVLSYRLPIDVAPAADDGHNADSKLDRAVRSRP